jgi:tRNA-specific adenosine deaminase 3
MDWREVQLPTRLPETVAQANFFKSYWPCRFHPDQGLEARLAKDGGIPGQELLRLKQLMRQAVAERRCLLVERRSGAQALGVGSGQSSSAYPLRHSVMEAIESVARRQREAQLPSEEAQVREYLCSGWDAVLPWEPCVMCAYALLHSRSGNVFYCADRPASGGLGSLFSVHLLPSTNHRFSVFKLHCPSLLAQCESSDAFSCQ